MSPDTPPIFDADVHIHETYSELTPYFETETPWRKEPGGQPPGEGAKGSGGERFLDTPGYHPLTSYDPILVPLPETEPHRVTSPEILQADFRERRINGGLIFTGRLLRVASMNSHVYAARLARAFNRYLAERWVDPGQGIYAAIMAANQAPDEAAAEIERYASVDGFVAVYLPCAGNDPLWGDRMYEPIFAAAQAADLPVVLQGTVTINTVFPYQLHHLPTALAKQTLSQSFGAQANLVSMLTAGVLARFPRLKVVFNDVGVTWLPPLLARLDHFYKYLREEVPYLELRPSEYARRQVYVTTHPLDRLEDPGHLVASLEAFGDDHVLFGSDWPHFDSTAPDEVLALLTGDRVKRNILGENARRLFRLGRE